MRGAQYADLTWSGATSPDVDVKRNGTVVATVANGGAYTEAAPCIVVCHTCRFFGREEPGYRCGLTGEPLSAADSTRICREHERVEG